MKSRRVPAFAAALLLTFASSPVSAQAQASIDLAICVDVGGGAPGDLDAVKKSAAGFLDRAFAAHASLRVSVVAYSASSSVPRLKVLPFTGNVAEARNAILNVSRDASVAGSSPVFSALLAALKGGDVGAWRPSSRKLVLLLGQTASPTDRTSLDDVVRAAQEVGAASILPLAMRGIGRAVEQRFAELARLTGGLMMGSRAADELADEMTTLVSLGSSLGGPLPEVAGQVVDVRGVDFEVLLDGPAVDVFAGLRVLVFSRSTAGLLIADGSIVKGEGARYLAQLKGTRSLESVSVGCPVSVVRN